MMDKGQQQYLELFHGCKKFRYIKYTTNIQTYIINHKPSITFNQEFPSKTIFLYLIIRILSHRLQIVDTRTEADRLSPKSHSYLHMQKKESPKATKNKQRPESMTLCGKNEEERFQNVPSYIMFSLLLITLIAQSCNAT